MNILLLVIGIIFAVSIFVGYKKGFLKIALSLAVTVASIFLVAAITPSISSWIQKSTSLGEKVESKLNETLAGSTGTTDGWAAVLEGSREQQIAAIEGVGLPKAIQEMLLENNNHEVYEALGVTTFVEYIGAYITKLIADIIAFLVAWVVVTIISRVLLVFVGILNKVPVIGGINQVAGGVVGLAVGFIIVWVMFIIITLLYNTNLGKTCFENIAASSILTKLYDGNLLMKYIVKF